MKTKCACIIGNHSSYHCGSAAAYDVIKKEVMRKYVLVKDANEGDLIVVNGEGTMHHGGVGCAKKVGAIERAIKQGKMTILINTVWQDNPQQFADIVRRCDQVYVREVLSQQALAAQGVLSHVAIDQSYFGIIDEDVPYIDFGNKIVFTDFYSKEYDQFIKLTSKWSQQYSYLDICSLSWSSLVLSLRTASCLVTGRHHAVYAACKARCPFIAMPGNTHKIEGLFRTMQIDVPVFNNFDAIKTEVERNQLPVNKCNELFDKMESLQSWKISI